MHVLVISFKPGATTQSNQQDSSICVRGQIAEDHVVLPYLKPHVPFLHERWGFPKLGSLFGTPK